VTQRLRWLFSGFSKEYNFHFLRSHISYLANYLRLFFISLFHKKIVAISLIEHIGDIIASEPISREIKKKHPDSLIIWFVRKPYFELLKYNPNVQKVFFVNCLTTWIKIYRNYKFDKVYDLHFNGRSCKICQIPLFKSNSNDLINGTNYFNYGGLLKAVCLHNKIEISDHYPQLYVPGNILTKSDRLIPTEPFIAIHCKSNEAIKDWENEKWEGLVDQLINDFNYHIVELGSHSNIKYLSGNFHSQCGKISLLETASIIKSASIFIGIDSGPAHMANALGTPGIILLGEYNFGMKNYNPFSGNYSFSKNARLIYSNDFVRNITVEAVINRVMSLIQEITESR
jgi:heptosyltransferase III